MTFGSRSLLLVSLIALASCAPVPLPQVAEPAAVTYDVRSLDLPSGMRLILEQDPTRPLISVVALVGAGGADDPAGKEGLAHFVEHLTFRSKHDGRTRLSNALAFAGVSEWNALTGSDTTTYLEVGPAESLESVLTLEGQRLIHPVVGLDDSSFEVERQVVLNELTTRDERGQYAPIQRAMLGALFPEGHPYRHPVSGTAASLASITRADVDAFVAAHYHPSNVTLVVSGLIDAQKVGALLDRVFPAEFLRVDPLARVHHAPNEPPAPPAGDSIVHVQAPVEKPLLEIAWTLPPTTVVPRTDTEFLLGFLNEWPLMADGVKDVDSAIVRGDQASILIAILELDETKKPDEVAKAVQERLDKLWAEGTLTYAYFVDQAFPRLRRAVLVQRELEAEPLLARAIVRAEDGHFRREGSAYGRELEDIASVTQAKVLGLGRKYITRERARLVVVTPKGQAPLEQAEGTTPFAEDDSVKAVYPPEVVRSLIHPPLLEGHQTLTLESGLEVTIVPVKGAGIVSVVLGAPGGELTARPVGITNLSFVMGHDRSYGSAFLIGGQSRQRVEDEVTLLELRGAAPNLEHLLSMLGAEVDTQEVSESWSVGLDKVRKELEVQESKPERRFDRRFERALWGKEAGMARRPETRELEPMRGGDFNAWLQRVFTPATAKVAIVGDVEQAAGKRLEPGKTVAQALRPMLEKWLGRWRRGPGKADPAATVAKAPEGARPRWVLEEKAGAPQAKLRLGCAVNLEQQNDGLALELLEEELERDLNELARGSLGGSYGFRASSTVGNRIAGLSVTGNTDNRHFPRVLAHARATWANLGSHPLDAEQLNRAKWNWARKFDLKLETSQPLAEEIVKLRLAGKPVEELTQLRERVMAVTSEDVARVALRCREGAVGGVLGDKSVLSTARNFVGPAEVAAAQ